MRETGRGMNAWLLTEWCRDGCLELLRDVAVSFLVDDLIDIVLRPRCDSFWDRYPLIDDSPEVDVSSCSSKSPRTASWIIEAIGEEKLIVKFLRFGEGEFNLSSWIVISCSTSSSSVSTNFRIILLGDLIDTVA